MKCCEERTFLRSGYILVAVVFLQMAGEVHRAWADPEPIEISPITMDKHPNSCAFRCTTTFTVTASDPEVACEEDNEVIVEWRWDGGDWEAGTPARGKGTFTKTYDIMPGPLTIEARAKEIPDPPAGCDEETGEAPKTVTKQVCMYNLLYALVDDTPEGSGVSVECGESVDIGAWVDGESCNIQLIYAVSVDGETVDGPRFANQSGFSFTPTKAGTYEVTVTPFYDCDCETKYAHFEVPCSCDCCGEAETAIAINTLPYVDDTCDEELVLDSEYEKIYFGPTSGPRDLVASVVYFAPGTCYIEYAGIYGQIENHTTIVVWEDDCGRVVEIDVTQTKVCFAIDPLLGIPYYDPQVPPEQKKTFYYPCGGTATRHECEGIDPEEDPSGECG